MAPESKPGPAAPPDPQAATGRPGDRRAGLYLRIAIAVALVALLLRWVDFRAAVHILAGTDPWNVLGVVGLALLDRFLMAYKWNLLLRVRGGGFTTAEAYRVYLASLVPGTWLPTGLGSDLFRAMRVRVSGLSMGRATASIVVERAIGLLAILTLAAGALAVLWTVEHERFRRLALAVALLSVTVVAVLVLGTREGFVRLVRGLTGPIARFRVVRHFFDFHEAAMQISRHRRVLLWFFALSVVERFVQVLMNWSAARAIALPISLLRLTALVPISDIIVTLPISVGAIGVLEGTYVLFLGRVGLSPAEAVSLALLMRVIGWIMLVPAGAAFLWDAETVRRAAVASADRERPA